MSKGKKSSSKKNPGKVDFKQPAKGGSAAMPKATKIKDVAPKMTGKAKAPKKVAPAFKSVDAVVAFRKGKYGA